MKNSLGKSNWREIRQSKTRFLSILGIIFLGVAFFVGLCATGPDMLKTADQYYQKTKLADATILSTAGLTKEDIALVKADNEVSQVEGRYFLDLNLSSENQVLRLYSYHSQQKLNRLTVVQGQLPKKADEIVLDAEAKKSYGFKIGDKIKTGDTNSLLKKESYRIVGFVKSPEYIENISRGNTTVGKGAIDYFGYTLEKNFNQPVYSELLVRYKNLNQTAAYSERYDQRLKTNQKQLEKSFAKEPEKRLAAIQAAHQKQINAAKAQLASGEEQITAGQEKLTAAASQLQEAKAQLAKMQAEYDEKSAASQGQIDEREQLLAGKQTEYDEQNQALKAEEALRQKKANADEIKATANQKIAATDQSLAEKEKVQNALSQILAILTEIVNQQNQSRKEQLTALANQLSTSEKNLVNQAITSDTSQAYSDVLAQLTTYQTNLTEEIDQLNQTKTTSQNQITEVEAALTEDGLSNSAYTKLKNQVEQLNEYLTLGKEQLTQAQTDLKSSQASAQRQISEAQNKIASAQKNYDENAALINQQHTETLKAAETQIAKEEAVLKKLTAPSYIFKDRSDNAGYSEYADNADRVSSLATVFPIIFFLIAALVTLTTMTRMVEEKRTELGTLKALGFNNFEIAQKYLLYAALASSLGTLIGLAVGFYFLPVLIFNAYGQMYNLTDMATPWYLSYSLIALAVALLCSVGATLFVLRFDLRATPAALMQPRAPKSGKRILLERITPVWRHLSFIQKFTLRNLFRYKQRMLMTVIGIAGCMSMVVTGFGLRDSIGDIVTMQFDKLWHYQATVTFNNDMTSQQQEDYQAALEKIKGYDSQLVLANEAVTALKTGERNQEVSLRVAKNTKNLNQFIVFQDRKTEEKYQLNNNGVIINEKLARLFDLAVGDKLVVRDGDNQKVNLKISAISENYVGHFIYLTPQYYRQIFDKQPSYNTDLLKFSQTKSVKQEDRIAHQLMENSGVANVTFSSKAKTALTETVDSLNIIMWVLIVSAGLLAFIVLYNLTNINISERIRELSTIKVLGFYDKEVVTYVYRENILLTLMGIVCGMIFGKIEHGYILQTVEVDVTMFSPIIQPLSYLYASGITLLFALIVGVMMYYRLKKINMIEALKAND